MPLKFIFITLVFASISCVDDSRDDEQKITYEHEVGNRIEKKSVEKTDSCSVCYYDLDGRWKLYRYGISDSIENTSTSLSNTYWIFDDNWLFLEKDGRISDSITIAYKWTSAKVYGNYRGSPSITGDFNHLFQKEIVKHELMIEIQAEILRLTDNSEKGYQFHLWGQQFE